MHGKMCASVNETCCAEGVEHRFPDHLILGHAIQIRQTSARLHRLQPYMPGVLAAPLRPAVRPLQTAVPQRHKQCAPRRCSASLGSDAASGMLDLAKLVSSDGSGRKTPYDGLASKLGELDGRAPVSSAGQPTSSAKYNTATPGSQCRPRCVRGSQRMAPVPEGKTRLHVDAGRTDTHLQSATGPQEGLPSPYHAQDMRGTGDLKMSQVLATAYGEVVKSDGRVDEKELTDLLKKMPVSIGAGKQTVRIQRVALLLWCCPDSMHETCRSEAEVHCAVRLAGELVRLLASSVPCGRGEDLRGLPAGPLIRRDHSMTGRASLL